MKKRRRSEPAHTTNPTKGTMKHEVHLNPDIVMELSLELLRLISRYGVEQHPEMITQEALASILQAAGYLIASTEDRTDRADLIANVERILPAVLNRALAGLNAEETPAAPHPH
jgi:hypothetical protein